MKLPRASLWVGIVFLGVAAVVLWNPSGKLWIYNQTASMPIGLYWYTGQIPTEGDVVAVDSLRAQNTLILAKTQETLIKTLEAGPGDRVVVVAGTVFINDRFVCDSPAYLVGDQIDCDLLLGQNEYFLGGLHPRGFDSRYWGPVGSEDLSVLRKAL